MLLQAAQADYLKSSSRFGKSSAESSNNYGAIGSHVQRMEAALNSNQKVLSNTEFYDLQSRLYSLKQSAMLDLSKGGNATDYVQPAQSLELELSRRVKESTHSSSSSKIQADLELSQLEVDFLKRRSELDESEAKQFTSKIDELKESLDKTDEQELFRIDHLLSETRDLKAKMIDRFVFGPRRYDLHASKSAVEISPAASNGKADAPLIPPSKNEDASQNAQSKETYKEARKPYKPISKLIQEIENQLINFHEKLQIGTFDLDSFSERLLLQKRNLKVMMSRTGRITLRQEAVLRQELEKIEADLHDRVLGKN